MLPITRCRCFLVLVLAYHALTRPIASAIASIGLVVLRCTPASQQPHCNSKLTRCLWSHLHAVSNSPTAGLLREKKAQLATSVRSGRHRAWNDTRVSLILCLVNFSASTPSHQNPNYTTHQARRVKSRGSHAPARGPPSYDWECAEARSARYVRMRFQHDCDQGGRGGATSISNNINLDILDPRYPHSVYRARPSLCDNQDRKSVV